MAKFGYKENDEVSCRNIVHFSQHEQIVSSESSFRIHKPYKNVLQFDQSHMRYDSSNQISINFANSQHDNYGA